MGTRDVEQNRKIVGYVIIGIAVYFVLRSIGLLDFLGIGSLIGFFIKLVIAAIPVVIIIIGMMWLGKSDTENRPVAAWCLIIFGAAILLSQFDVFGLSFGNMIIPLLLICLAIKFLRPQNTYSGLDDDEGESEGDLADTSSIKLFAFMGGGEEVYSSQNLKGGEVNAIMGGYQIDLRDADTDGDIITLNLFCIMGGVELLVPPNWVVEKHLFCFMGGFGNKTRCIAEKLDLPRRKLIITGFVLMGGGEIKN